MKKHLLVYDYDWWVLGTKARILQSRHPSLEIASNRKIKELVKKKGAAFINRTYTVIATLSLGLAQLLYRLRVRVDASQIGSYNYFMKNHDTFREWKDAVLPDSRFIQTVMKPIRRFGAINPKLAQEVQRLVPDRKVAYIRQFVDTNRFYPAAFRASSGNKLVIGWAGNNTRGVKNYETLYQPVKAFFQKDPRVKFREASRTSRVSPEKMPSFYRSLDLLMITSSNEGGPAPAMEANACGVPVLSTNVGYVKKITPPRGKPFVLDSHHPKDFINKIRWLEQHPQTLAAMKQDAARNILEHWTVEQTINDWLYTLFRLKH
ncbi:glycosyltransferase family 4 protein [Salibacterium sp. K-3]